MLEKAILACEATLDMHVRAAQRRGLDASSLQLGLMLLSDGRLRERALELLADPAELDRVLASNADRAAEVADATLADVYDKVGLLRRR